MTARRAGPFTALLLLLAMPTQAANAIRIVLLGDDSLFGYNLPPEEELPTRLLEAVTATGRSAEIVRSPNLDDSRKAAIWLITRSAKAALADPAGTVLIVSSGHWDCGLMSVDETTANLETILGAFAAAQIPILLVATSPRNECGSDYETAYQAIFPTLAEQYETLLYMNMNEPPDYAVPTGATFMARPEPFHALWPHVERLIERAERR